MVFTWSMFFAKLPLKARGWDLKVGDPFPVQDKRTIRGMASAYGFTGLEQTPFNELPYVDIVTFKGKPIGEDLAHLGLTARDARALAKKVAQAAQA
jgi:hypothetical protein